MLSGATYYLALILEIIDPLTSFEYKMDLWNTGYVQLTGNLSKNQLRVILVVRYFAHALWSFPG